MPTPDDLAKQLERASKNQRRWLEERDELVHAAYKAGGGIREIARLVNVSHPTIIRILRIPAEPGEPRTRDGYAGRPPGGRE